MLVLVIPDVHLKPAMFERAADLLRANIADTAVCLMDIADDWGQEKNLGLYEETYGAAIEFAKEFPESLFCYGNHDVSYVIQMYESGYSLYAEPVVREKIRELDRLLDESGRIAFVQKIDNVLFSHGGVTDDFVRTWVKSKDYNNVDAVVRTLNEMNPMDMWNDGSPIWARAQYGGTKIYKPKKLLQVVGHTPVRGIERMGNLISCDNFSTYPDGAPIGSREFLILDTESWGCLKVR